ncbi:MAG: DNA-binding response regulator [Muricauda sp. TMED12]|nr:MAG: DNA-binding response regulator [Muricauda sp. TMED12]
MNLLFRKFPIEISWKKDLAIVGLVTVFPPMFILLFQPFGIDIGTEGISFQKLIIVIGYGLISGLLTTIVCVFLPFYVPKVFENFKVWSAFLFYLAFILLLSSANFLYNVLWDDVSGFPLDRFFIMTRRTILIAAIPLSLAIYIAQQSRLKSNLASASRLNQNNTLSDSHTECTIISDNGKEVIKVSPQSFLYVVNADNYAWIHFTLNQNPHRVLIRGSLKKIQEQLKEMNCCFRCHRSYIVNMDKVVKATGDSRGLELALEGVDTVIPVSRRYIGQIMESLK